METREAITVDPRAQRRLHVLNHVLAGALTAAQAAELLELSLRQVRRLLAGYRVEGVGARRREARPYPPDGKAGGSVRRLAAASCHLSHRQLTASNDVPRQAAPVHPAMSEDQPQWRRLT